MFDQFGRPLLGGGGAPSAGKVLQALTNAGLGAYVAFRRNQYSNPTVPYYTSTEGLPSQYGSNVVQANLQASMDNLAEMLITGQRVAAIGAGLDGIFDLFT